MTKKEISKYVFRSKAKAGNLNVAGEKEKFIGYLAKQPYVEQLDEIALEQFPLHYYSKIK